MPAFTRWRLHLLRCWTSNCSSLLIYRPREDERLSWPGWLTSSRRFTHMSGHWSPISWRSSVQQGKFAGQDRRSTIVPRLPRAAGADERTEKDSAGFMDSKEKEWVGAEQSWSKEGPVRHCQSKETIILWSYHEETRELPGKRDNTRNNARCTQARKTTHDLDGQYQDVDRTSRGRVNQNDRGQR